MYDWDCLDPDEPPLNETTDDTNMDIAFEDYIENFAIPYVMEQLDMFAYNFIVDNASFDEFFDRILSEVYGNDDETQNSWVIRGIRERMSNEINIISRDLVHDIV